MITNFFQQFYPDYLENANTEINIKSRKIAPNFQLRRCQTLEVSKSGYYD